VAALTLSLCVDNGQVFINIQQLEVDPDHRRQGLGTQLVSLVKEFTGACTIKYGTVGMPVRLITCAAQDSQSSLPFFKKMGFEEEKDPRWKALEYRDSTLLRCLLE
jgi:GNAT superfamily N-acetyltransferase